MKTTISLGVIAWALAVVLIIAAAVQLKVAHTYKPPDRELGKTKDLPEQEFYFNRIVTVDPAGTESVVNERGRLYLNDHGIYCLSFHRNYHRFVLRSRGIRTSPGVYFFQAITESGTRCSISEHIYMNRLISVNIRTGGFLQTFE